MNIHKDHDTHAPPPFPHIIVYGRLRLAGVKDDIAYRITTEAIRSAPQKDSIDLEEYIFNDTLERIEEIDHNWYEHLKIINKYEMQRRKDRDVPPILLVLEGASATGKSMLALTLATDIAATRLLSTDTIRQILRATYSKQDAPELFCHTYQAFKYRQTGPDRLSPVVRGFLAQYEIIDPHLRKTVRNVSSEGATGLVEGVHIIPGEFRDIAGAVEILIEPGPELHKNMFMDKRGKSGLTTITKEYKTRMEEFAAARLIQEHMLTEAKEHGVPIIRFATYSQAASDIRTIIVEHMKRLTE
ncbi:MAG: hypothetical protein K9W43_11855 [Candidatus Thorarchaeota archaeon]|nr:hypothetical protein [Candidatus Thorarchaeota archaeon]